MLYRILQDQINNQRYTLVFFNNIETMIKTFSVYKQKITKLTYVHSEDVFRFEKVEQLNRTFRCHFYYDNIRTWIYNGKFGCCCYRCTSIYSRGFNTNCWTCWTKIRMSYWKSIVFHEGVSMNMIQAKKEIQRMNKLALKKNWADE